MATIIQGRESSGSKVNRAIGEAGEKFIQATSDSYKKIADEKAIKGALEKLPPGASMRDTLQAITKTNTYDPKAKQQAIENFSKSYDFDLKERQIASNEKIAKGKIENKNQLKEEKTASENNETKALYRLAKPEATEEEVAAATKDLRPADVRSLISKPENVTEYDIAKNHAKRLIPIVDDYIERGQKARDIKSTTESAIILNEKYDTTSKYWDAAVGLLPGDFSQILKTNDGQQLAAYTPVAISKFSDKMSGVLSVKKLNILEQKAASPNKDKATNRLMIYMDLFSEKLDILRAEFTDDILSKDKYGLPPKDFNKQINEKMKPYQKMIDADLDLLLKGHKPKSPMGSNDIVDKKKAAAKPGEVLVYDDKGNDFYMSENLYGTPGYEGYKRYE